MSRQISDRTPSHHAFHVHKNRWRRLSRILALALSLTAIAGPAENEAWAQSSYPEHQVRIIVAFAPGGIADVMARVIAQKLSAKFSQTFVVENRSGAGGTLGARMVSSATSDGHTLLVTTTALAINAVAMKNAVDPHTQLTPVAVIAAAPMIFVATKDATAPDLMTFVRDTKKGRFTYSSAGVGTAEHLTSEYIYKQTPGLDGTHVPFPGGLVAVTAVIAGTVDLATATVPSALSLMNNGDLRVLAVTSRKRLDSLPNVPTLKEAGFPDLATASWIAMFAPPGTPMAVVEKLNAEINAALAEPDVRKRLADLGFIAQQGSQKAFSDSLTSEVEEWRNIVKTTGFSPN